MEIIKNILKVFLIAVFLAAATLLNVIFFVCIEHLFYTGFPFPYLLIFLIVPLLLGIKKQETFIQNLSLGLPDYTIMSDFAIDEREERRFSNYAPLIDDYIRTYYVLERLVPYDYDLDFEIMLR